MKCLSMNDADRAVDIVESIIEDFNDNHVNRTNNAGDIFERVLGWGHLQKDVIYEVVARLTEAGLSFMPAGASVSITVPFEWNAQEMYTW